MRVTYSGGTLAEDDRQALRQVLPDIAPESSANRWLSVSSELFDAVELTAQVYAQNALDAAGRLDRVLNEALLRTGLFEQFDVSGKSVEVRPAQRADED
jgi:hypothetical protein